MRSFLVLAQERSVIFFDNKFNVSHVIQVEDYRLLVANEFYLLINHDFKGKITVIDTHTLFETYINIQKNGNVVLYKKFLLWQTYNEDFSIYYIEFFDIPNQKFLWKREFNYGILTFPLGNILLQIGSVISKIDESTGDALWERELGSGVFRKGLRDLDVKISHLVGVWKNQLLVWMNNEQLICLDVNTGTELWRITDFIKQFLPNWQSISQFSFVYCHIENGKLYQLDGDSYWSLDLATQEFELLWQDTQKEYLTIIHKTYTEDFIYFTASRNYGLVPYLIGVFNRKTLSIEWLHDARLPQKAENNFCNSLNQAPQVDGNKLYVLDSGGTLHIFEKESSIE